MHLSCQMFHSAHCWWLQLKFVFDIPVVRLFRKQKFLLCFLTHLLELLEQGCEPTILKCSWGVLGLEKESWQQFLLLFSCLTVYLQACIFVWLVLCFLHFSKLLAASQLDFLGFFNSRFLWRVVGPVLFLPILLRFLVLLVAQPLLLSNPRDFLWSSKELGQAGYFLALDFIWFFSFFMSEIETGGRSGSIKSTSSLLPLSSLSSLINGNELVSIL